MPPTGDLAHNLGMCPDWESNLWLFASQAGTQPTEPHKQGQGGHFILLFRKAEKQFLVGACGLLFNTI